MGLDSQPMVEISHRDSSDNREGTKGIEQAKEASNSASLGRIRMAGPRKEGHQLPGHIGFTHGEHANNEAISKFSLRNATC